MPTTPPDRLDFVSAEWIAAAREVLEEALADTPGADDSTSFSMCETFTDAPPHLAGPDGSVSWHARIDGRRVETGAGPLPDADLRITADHTAAVEVASTQYAAAPDAVARVQRQIRHRLGPDTMTIDGRFPDDPAVGAVLLRLHDELAARTVDGSSLDHRLARHGLTEAAEQLRDVGYCVLTGAVTDSFADELREAILAKIAENPFPTPAALLLERGRIFEEAALHPWLLTLGEFVCGKGSLLAQLLGSTRGEGPGLLGLHSDYNNVRAPFPEYGLNCTACWALDDWTVEAGPTVVVPGSNRWRSHPDERARSAERLAIEMPKGSIALWDGATWHAQGDRSVPGQRVVLHQTFSRLTLRPYDDYSRIDPAILDRNPAILTTMCGLDDIFAKNTTAGPQFHRMLWSREALTT